MTAEELIAFEHQIADAFNRGEIRAPVHLAGGNEQQLIEIFLDIRPQDWVLVQWRSHYHCLLKGVPPAVLKADIMAGRSITLCYPQHRILSSAIVGGHLPIALGLAWSIKRSGEDAHVWAFLGDMTSATGIFAESIDYAEGHVLPIKFIVENNGLSVCTNTLEVCRGIPTAVASEVREDFNSLREYHYDLSWPHSGARKRVEF